MQNQQTNPVNESPAGWFIKEQVCISHYETILFIIEAQDPQGETGV